MCVYDLHQGEKGKQMFGSRFHYKLHYMNK